MVCLFLYFQQHKILRTSAQLLKVSDGKHKSLCLNEPKSVFQTSAGNGFKIDKHNSWTLCALLWNGQLQMVSTPSKLLKIIGQIKTEIPNCAELYTVGCHIAILKSIWCWTVRLCNTLRIQVSYWELLVHAKSQHLYSVCLGRNCM